MEEHLTEMRFPTVSIFRPGLLKENRDYNIEFVYRYMNHNVLPMISYNEVIQTMIYDAELCLKKVPKKNQKHVYHCNFMNREDKFE